MKTQLHCSSFLRSLIIIATLATISKPVSAASTDSGRASHAIVLASGPVRVTAAGPYVEVGTYRIQVSAKLGSPTAVLEDGSWLYRGYRLGESNVRGSLLVTFESGCVSDLQLIPREMATALLAKKAAGPRIAARSN